VFAVGSLCLEGIGSAQSIHSRTANYRLSLVWLLCME
jgi:hypothetical protein